MRPPMGQVRDDVVTTVERSPLFAGFPRKQLQEMVQRFDDQTFLAEHGVVSEGMHGMEFFLILEGSAEVVVDGTVLATLQPGDFFGEVAALDDGPRTASVRTATKLRCLGLPNRTFKQFLLDYPLFAVNMLPTVVRRFRAVMTSAKSQRLP
ncbi:MAG: cyclic nucleotide-binding domain-containing protein [Chloroflexi bacterium]|nr:MAG: cyclic nucleotide-binding domain-containing protein [Chloroflexota bacterium]